MKSGEFQNKLKAILDAHFSIHELKQLLFELGQDFENFDHQTKDNLMRETIRYFSTRDELSQLIEKICDVRPNLLESYKSVLGPYTTKAFSGVLLEENRNKIIEIIQTNISWVKSVKNADGGFPTDEKGFESGVWTTSGLLWALWYSGVNFHQTWITNAIRWVIQNFNEDGGAPITKKGDASVTDSTAQTIMALTLYYIESNDEEIKQKHLSRCVEWLIKNYQIGEGWFWKTNSTVHYIASSAYAVLALQYAQKVFPDNIDIASTIQDATLWLKSCQNLDGGWGNMEGRPSEPAVTGLVTSVLLEMNNLNNDKSVIYILNSQNKNGGWQDSIDRPDGHTIIRLGNSHCTRTLALSNYSMKEEKFKSAFNAFMQIFDGSKFVYNKSTMAAWPTRDGLLTLTTIAQILKLQNIRSPLLNTKK